MNIKINVLNSNVNIPKELVDAADGDELLVRIFHNRGYRNADTIRQMLHEGLYTPAQPYEFPGMQEAVNRIQAAINTGEKIFVYGDYDVDGVTSTVTLVQTFGFLGSRAGYHVPDRFAEGYGMNIDIISGLPAKGVSLIVTCDCGISNHAEVQMARELGMDVIITDHHNLPHTLPGANVILNPKLLEEGHKARNISGCGMAYFLSAALLEQAGMQEKAHELLDMLALSLVADVVSLNGENRYLLKKALPALFSTKRTGLKELFAVIEQDSKLKNEEDIAFQIAPRINAAGRMESARLPVELFLCNNMLTAGEMARRIDLLNKSRKETQQQIIEQAVKQVEEIKKNKTVLVLYNEFWHHGIIGIAAGKICETYRKPAILLTLKEDGQTVVGSARSTDSIDIYELIKECGSRLLKFGGHAKAAGLSLMKEDIDTFTGEIETKAEELYFIKDTVQVDVDMELGLGDASEELLARLERAGPYGEGFEQPLFLSRNITVVSDRKTAKNHHIMVLAGQNGERVPAVKWFGGDESLQDKVFDVVYKLGINTYRGKNELQLTVGYLSEISGKPVEVFKGILIDARMYNVNDILSNFRDAVIFYEGLASKCPVEETFDRYNISTAENLVFLSTPAGTGIFREVVSRVNPENIIINFSASPDYSFNGFMLSLMGILKYVANNENGRTRMEYLSSRLCVEEGIVRAALKYIKELGMIELFIDNESNAIFIGMCKKNQGSELVSMEKNLRAALLEKSAYQQFIMKLDIARFKEYLK